MKKILIIQPWIKLGGAELISLYLAKELASLGYEAKIVCLFVNHKGLPDFSKSIRYVTPHERISSLFQKSRLFFLLFGPIVLLYLCIKESHKNTILNPHNFPSSWIAILVGSMRKIPIVWTCNEPPLRVPLDELKSVGILDYLGWFIASSFIDRTLIKKFIDTIVVIDNKNYLKVRNVYNKKAIINHLGIDFDFFQKAKKLSRISTFKVKDHFVLLCVGKLHSQKNQELAIRVIEKLKHKISNILLVLAGDGPARKILEKLVMELEIEKHVVFLGAQTAKQVRDLYKSADLVLFPAKRHQSWGLVPVEALVVSCLSVVSSSTGIAEVLQKQKAAIVCKPTVNAFSEAIYKYFKNKQKYNSMVKMGNKYVKNNLTWKSYAKNMSDVFEAVEV